MKAMLMLAALAAFAADAAALPKVGYYKSYYSADHGAYGCAQITSNTKQIKVGTKKVAFKSCSASRSRRRGKARQGPYAPSVK